MAKHKNRLEWESLYNDFLKYKGTIISYCNKNNINYKTFKNWYYKLKKINTISTQSGSKFSNNNNKMAQSKFIQLRFPWNETITIKLPNGIIVETTSKNLPTIIKELAYVI